MTEELERITGLEFSEETENGRLFQMLDHVERQMQESRLLAALGVDDALISAFREYLRDPQIMVDSMTEHLGTMFVLSLWEETKEKDLTRHVVKMGVGLNGSRVDIWVFLKDESFNFETRSEFYELNAELSNSRPFSKIDADLHVLRESDGPLPATYTLITF